MKLNKITLTPPIVAIIVSFGLMLSASATSWFVATDGNDTDNAGSETSPFATLAKAYAEAADTGDEIVVKPGTYVMSAELTVKKGVTIRSSTGVAEDVKIDGNKKVRPLILNNAGAKLLNVCVEKGAVSSAAKGVNVLIDAAGGVLEGCIIRGGTHSSGSRGNSGGAIACTSDAGLIVNCVITNNSVTSNNTSPQGGGLLMTKGKAVGCFIGYNKAIISNGMTYGGGVHLQGTSMLVNCTIANNSACVGAGIDAYADTVKVVNCVIWGNVGDGDYVDYYGKGGVFMNCVSRYPINENCQSFDSLPAEGTFLVPTAASPCLDASIDVEGVTLPAMDIFGNPRVVGAAADLGCAERQPTTSPEADIRISQSVGIAPFTSTLTACTENLTGITAYNWDFDGDGTVDETTTGPDVTHEYKDYVYRVVPTVSIVHSGGITDGIASFAVSAMPKTMYVNGKCATPAVPYATEETAAATIAAAVKASIDGQEIIVMKEGSPYDCKTAANCFEVTRAVTVRGETGNPEDVICQGKGARVIRVGSAKASVQSLTVQGVTANLYGVGVMIETSGGTVSNCVIRNCSVGQHWTSAAVYLRGDDSLVTHCVITNNSSTYAGTTKAAGIEVKDGARAANCLIAGNKDTATGGAKSTTGGAYVNKGYLYNCTVVDNTGGHRGGVHLADAVSDRVVNCVLAGNKATLFDCHNYPTDKAAAFSNCASDDASPINSTCQADSAANLFKNYAIGDYTAASGDSKLVDKGKDYEGMASKDLAGKKRVMGKAVDIGAYEYDNETARLEGGLAADRDKGIAPQVVTFAATVGGTNGTDAIQFSWDFDGDGTYDKTTMDPVCPHLYAESGVYTVKLLIEDLTSGQSCLVEKPNLLNFVGARMYVTSDFNPGAEYPYDTIPKATSNLTTAVDAAQDGVEIIVLKGEHRIRARTTIAADVTLHGETGNPDDVVMRNAAGSAMENLLVLNNAGALVHGITWENNSQRPGWKIDTLGGTLSNCVIRGFQNYQYHATVGALTVASEKGLATHCVITNNLQGGGEGGNGDKAIVHVIDGRIENSLIAYNKIAAYTSYFLTTPLVRVGGAMVNCTIVGNEVIADTAHFQDWASRATSDSHSETVRGAITNCIVASNTVVGEPATVLTLTSTKGRGNIADVDCDGEVPGWYRAADASEIFDAESAVSPWAISLAAAHKFPGARRATADTTDLAGNPRYTGKRLDPGCYQCPKSFGLMLKVK